MKVLIIEDEERGFSRLKRLLQNIDNSMEIEGPLTTMRAVIDYLQNPHDEDVIFADIRLGDGDVFEAFLEIAPTSPVIFTTAYNEYALEAFKSNGIAYLQKPARNGETISLCISMMASNLSRLLTLVISSRRMVSLEHILVMVIL